MGAVAPRFNVASSGPEWGQIWARMGTGLDQNGARTGPEWSQIWARMGTELGQNGARSGPEWGQVWARMGPDLGQIRIEMGSLLMTGLLGAMGLQKAREEGKRMCIDVCDRRSGGGEGRPRFMRSPYLNDFRSPNSGNPCISKLADLKSDSEINKI